MSSNKSKKIHNSSILFAIVYWSTYAYHEFEQAYLDSGNFLLGSIFVVAAVASKTYAHFKIGQKWLKNNHTTCLV